MNEFNVRPASRKDLPILLEFEQGVIEAERPFDPTLPEGKINYYNLDNLLSSEDAKLVVAERDSQIIACGYAIKKRARHYLDHEFYSYMGFMFTHEAYRGQGANAAVIENLKEWSFSKGLTEIRLSVYDENIPAIKAYEKIGFKKHLIEMRIQ